MPRTLSTITAAGNFPITADGPAIVAFSALSDLSAYSTGTPGAGQTFTSVPSSAFDNGSHTIAAGDRCLVPSGTGVGTYVLTSNASNWNLARSTDLATDAQCGTRTVNVTNGAQGPSGYIQTGATLTTLAYTPAGGERTSLSLLTPQVLAPSGAGGWVTLTGDDGQSMSIDCSALTNLQKLEVGVDASSINISTGTITEMRVNRTYTMNGTTPTLITDSSAVTAADIQLAVVSETLALQGKQDASGGATKHFSAEVWSRVKQVGVVGTVINQYPQQGTFGTGGYFDANHGVTLSSGANVSQVASREGAAVLVQDGAASPQLTGSAGNYVIQCATNAALKSLQTTIWNNFKGTKTPFIMGIKFVFGTYVAGGRIVTMGTSSHRRIDILENTNIVQFTENWNGVASTINQTATTGNSYTFVYVLHSDGNFYVVSDGGTSSPVAAQTQDYNDDQNLYINSFFAGGNDADIGLKIFCMKTPATGNALTEAQGLYTGLVAQP